MRVDNCGDEARSSRSAHRSQGIAYIEGEIVRHSAQEHDYSYATQGQATQGETIMQYACVQSTARTADAILPAQEPRATEQASPAAAQISVENFELIRSCRLTATKTRCLRGSVWPSLGTSSGSG